MAQTALLDRAPEIAYRLIKLGNSLPSGYPLSNFKTLIKKKYGDKVSNELLSLMYPDPEFYDEAVTVASINRAGINDVERGINRKNPATLSIIDKIAEIEQIAKKVKSLDNSKLIKEEDIELQFKLDESDGLKIPISLNRVKPESYNRVINALANSGLDKGFDFFINVKTGEGWILKSKIKRPQVEVLTKFNVEQVFNKPKITENDLERRYVVSVLDSKNKKIGDLVVKAIDWEDAVDVAYDIVIRKGMSGAETFKFEPKEVDMNEGDTSSSDEKYYVIMKGGSIGEKGKKIDKGRSYLTKQEAKDHARALNKLLTPGEKSYYKIRYVVVSEKDLTEMVMKETYLESDRTYFDLSMVPSREINKLNDELSASGLKVGEDFFFKSDGNAWLRNAKYDYPQVEILKKYGVEELEEGIKKMNKITKMIIEAVELDKAEIVLAVKNISDELQDMVEKLSKIQVQELLPIIERIKQEYSVDYAYDIESKLSGSIENCINSVKSSKDEVDNVSLELSGEVPINKMEREDDADSVNTEDAFDVTDSMQGPEEEPLGRAKREIGEGAIPKGHTIEAHGIMGMSNKKWRKSFKDYESMSKWADENDAEVIGTRSLENSIIIGNKVFDKSNKKTEGFKRKLKENTDNMKVEKIVDRLEKEVIKLVDSGKCNSYRKAVLYTIKTYEPKIKAQANVEMVQRELMRKINYMLNQGILKDNNDIAESSEGRQVKGYLFKTYFKNFRKPGVYLLDVSNGGVDGPFEDSKHGYEVRDEYDNKNDIKVVYFNGTEVYSLSRYGDQGSYNLLESPNKVKDPFKENQIKIAKQTLKLSDLGSKAMGGMTKDQARDVLKKSGMSDKQIKKLEEADVKSKSDHTIEAHGVMGMSNKKWQKKFKNRAELGQWVDDNDATVFGTRDLKSAKRGSLSPALESKHKKSKKKCKMNESLNDLMTWYLKEAEAKLGSGTKFKNLSAELKKKGVENPDALSAWIGRKKYGKEAFQKISLKGKK